MLICYLCCMDGKFRKLKLEELGRLSLVDYREKKKLPLVVVLDNIRSGHNVGAVFRTCDALAIEHIYLCGFTPRPPHREILKSAIGASESVEWTHFESTKECLKFLKNLNYLIAGIEQTTGSTHLRDFNPPQARVAVVLGNEIHGLSDDILVDLDECLEIEQFGTKHSFNVSVCAGIVLWNVATKMRMSDSIT